MLTLLLTPEKTAVASIYTEGQIALPRVSIEEVPIAVGKLTRIQNPEGQELWEPVDLTGWVITAAIGRPFLPTTHGTFVVNHDGDASAPILMGSTAAEIQQELANVGILVAVEEISEGYYRLTWTIVGARPLVTVDPEGLVPSAVAETKMLTEGSVDTKSIQTIRLLQYPAASGVLSDYTDEVTATVTVLQTGGAGDSHQIRVRLEPVPNGGTWAIEMSGKSPEFTFDADAATVQAGLEETLYGVDPVGAGNVVVIKDSAANYFIEFVGEHGGEDMGTISAIDTRLRTIPLYSGFIDTNTEAMEALMGTENEISMWLEITGTPPTGADQKLYREPITVVAPILRPAIV